MVEPIIFKEGTKLDEGKGPSAKDLPDKLIQALVQDNFGMYLSLTQYKLH